MRSRCWGARRIRGHLLCAVLFAWLAGPALAEDPTQTLSEPHAPTSKLVLSANATFTTDYIFRGISQTDEGPAVQGGFELDYKILYLGVWGSNTDFGSDFNPAGKLVTVAPFEIDWYGGVRSEWKGISFDLSVLYYTFPGALKTWKLDYVEFGTTASYTFFDRLTLGVANWWTPNNSGDLGPNDVVESSASYAFNTVSIFSPSVSALIGRQWGDESEGGTDYTYWNAGLTLEFNERPAFSLDVRYWDTNLPGCSSATLFQCGERVVGTVNAYF